MCSRTSLQNDVGRVEKSFEYLKWSAPGATVINIRTQPKRHLININCDAASTMITNKGVPACYCDVCERARAM